MTPDVRMVDGKPVWARDVHKGETVTLTGEQFAALATRDNPVQDLVLVGPALA